VAIVFGSNSSNTFVTSSTTVAVTTLAPVTGQNTMAFVNCVPTGNQLPTATITDSLSGTWVSVGTPFTTPTTTSNGVGAILQTFYRTTPTTTAAFTITATFSAASANGGIRSFFVTGSGATPTVDNSAITISSSLTTTALSITSLPNGDGYAACVINTGTGVLVTSTPPVFNFTSIGSVGSTGVTSAAGRVYSSTVTGISSVPATNSMTGTVTSHGVIAYHLYGISSFATTGSAAISLSGSATANLDSISVQYVTLLKSASSAAATTYTTASVTPLAGSYVIASLQVPGATAPTISDSLGGTWVAAASLIASGGNSAGIIYWRSTISNGSSFTITVGGVSVSTLAPKIYVIGAIANSLGTYSAKTSATGTTAIPTLTTPSASKAGDLYFAAATALTGGTNPLGATATSGYSISVQLGGTNPTIGIEFVQYKTATSATTSSVAGTLTTGTPSLTTQQSIVIYAGNPVTATGAVSLAGTATVDLSYSVTASGEINITGSGTPSIIANGAIDLTATGTAQLLQADGSGSLSLIGSATQSLSYESIGSGAISLTATATDQLLQSSGSGSLSLSASANDQLEFVETANGNVSLVATGALGTVVYYPVTADGSLTLMAGTPDTLDYPATGSGNIGIAGNAYVALVYHINGSASVSLNGTGKPLILGNASIVLTGIGSAYLTQFATASGHFDLLGSAIAQLKYRATASGSVTLNGNAVDSIYAVGFVGWGQSI